MNEEVQKEIISTVKDEIEDIKSSLKERMKLPLLITFCVIITLYNWDILLYLVFEPGKASYKITYIKTIFDNSLYHRYLCPLMLSIISTILFPTLQVLINLGFNFFKNKNQTIIKNEEIQKAKHEKILIDIKSDNKNRKLLQQEVYKRDFEIQKLKEEIFRFDEKIKKLSIDSENYKNLYHHHENEHVQSLILFNKFQEIFKLIYDSSFKSTEYLYFDNFNNYFFNFYSNYHDKEKKFIADFFDLLKENKDFNADINEIVKITSYDAVDFRALIFDLERNGLIKTIDDDDEFGYNNIKLTNKGIEALRIFDIINSDMTLPPPFQT